MIEPVADPQLMVGETIEIPLTISDADGDPIVLTAIAQDQSIVMAQAVGTDTVVLTGVGEGMTTVELTADDAQGGVTLSSFTVTVSAAPVGFDLNAYPVVPQIDQQSAAMLSQVYQSGVSNFGNRGNAFSKVGDESVASEHFMAPLASDQANLGNFGALQGLIDLYKAVPVRGDDPAVNSLTVDSTAAEMGFGIDSLSAPLASGAACGDGSASTASGASTSRRDPRSRW